MTGKYRLPLFFILVLKFFTPLFADNFEFVYNYNAGDMFRIRSTVDSYIFIDGVRSFRSEFLNRISYEVIDSDEDSASLSATYQSAERTTSLLGRPMAGGAFSWARDYFSSFSQNTLGYINIEDHYFMPMVRNVPVFPGRPLALNESWSAEGTTVHDFRDSFGIGEPYRIPFNANYTYLGERVFEGQSYPAFSIRYTYYLEPSPVSGRVYPTRIEGEHAQIVYWDTRLGQPGAYQENFTTIIRLSNGETWEYRGSAQAQLVEAPPMDRDELIREIAEYIEDIEGATVRASDEGVIISLEDIQFDPDSAFLRESERLKLDRIAEILLRYPNRDILVGGHTALAGTAEGRERLSLERAEAVAFYLLNLGIRRPEQVVIRGYGAEQPIADNNTEEGMRRNRRVEIIILEN